MMINYDPGIILIRDAKSGRYDRYICAISSKVVLILLYDLPIGTGTVSTPVSGLCSDHCDQSTDLTVEFD